MTNFALLFVFQTARTRNPLKKNVYVNYKKLMSNKKKYPK